MLEENKSSKNSIKDPSPMPTMYEAESSDSKSYRKTNKLVTALYMVTDIMDVSEPLRNQLRTLGVDILSDIYLPSKQGINKKADQILSLLDIAFALNMISEMNSNILKKEFLKLKESTNGSNPDWLENFLKSGDEDSHSKNSEDFKIASMTKISNIEENLLRHNRQGNRIGVQKGSTLLKALNGIQMSVNTANESNKNKPFNFDILKKQRREIIIKIIKDKPDGISIKDISISFHSLGQECGEKTLQRELVSMAQDGVLKKTGEKRWSRYTLI